MLGMFAQFPAVALFPYAALTLLFAVLLYRGWGERVREWMDDESAVSRLTAPNIPVTKLDMPFNTILSQDAKEIQVISRKSNWCVYAYSHIPIAAVVEDILKTEVNNEEYFELLTRCNNGDYTRQEHSSPGSQTAILTTEGRALSAGEARNTYPLMIVATDYKASLVCLVHIADVLVPTSYIIAQFYRSSSGVFHRLVPLYTSSADVDECSVCLSNTASCTLLPCRHKCACQLCVQRLTYCPVCRASIGSYFDTARAESR